MYSASQRSNILYSIILALLLPLAAFGQSPAKADTTAKKTYGYSTEYDDPARARNLHIGLMPLCLNYSPYNFSIGYCAQINYLLLNRVGVYGSYMRAYYDMNQNNVYANKPASDYQPYNTINAGLMVYVGSRMKEKKENVNLKEVKGTLYTMLIPVQRQVMYGIRAGYQHYTNIFTSKKDSVEGTSVQTGSRMMVSAPYATYMHIDMLSLGYSHLARENIRVKVEEFGAKKYSYREEYYIDLLYAPTMTFENVSLLVGDLGIPVIVNKDIKTRPYGLRLGYQEWGLAGFGFGVGMEAGMMPGPVTRSLADNLYAQIKLGFLINARI